MTDPQKARVECAKCRHVYSEAEYYARDGVCPLCEADPKRVILDLQARLAAAQALLEPLDGWGPGMWRKDGSPASISRLEQPNGPVRYAVRHSSFCLHVTSGEWEFEPMPSNRTDEWLDEHRFPTFEAAVEAVKKAKEWP